MSRRVTSNQVRSGRVISCLVRSGQFVSRRVSSGQVGSRRIRSGQVRQCQVGVGSLGEVVSGQFGSYRIRLGQVRSCQVRSGHVRTGQYVVTRMNSVLTPCLWRRSGNEIRTHSLPLASVRLSLSSAATSTPCRLYQANSVRSSDGRQCSAAEPNVESIWSNWASSPRCRDLESGRSWRGGERGEPRGHQTQWV